MVLRGISGRCGFFNAASGIKQSPIAGKLRGYGRSADFSPQQRLNCIARPICSRHGKSIRALLRTEVRAPVEVLETYSLRYSVRVLLRTEVRAPAVFTFPLSLSVVLS